MLMQAPPGTGKTKTKLTRIRVVRKRKAPTPPRYLPSPQSLLPLARCFRSDCRAVRPLGARTCPCCGAYGVNSEPLVKFVFYIEEFQK